MSLIRLLGRTVTRCGPTVAGLIALAWCWSVAAGAEILVVLSADKPPYRQAQAGLEPALAKTAFSSKVVLLDQLAEGEAFTGVAAVVAIGTPAAAWLHGRVPATVPLAYCMVTDPVANGLVTPPAAGGVATDIPLAAQLALIAEALPQARTIGMLYRGDQERGVKLVEQVRAALPSGWRLAAIASDRQPSIAAAIDALMKLRIDVVWTSPEGGIYNDAAIRSLLLTALRQRVPVFGFSPAFVRAGALLGVGINPATQGGQAADALCQLLDRMGKGSSGTGAPPIQLATTYEVAVNLVVAQLLAIDLPAVVVNKATHVFQPDR